MLTASKRILTKMFSNMVHAILQSRRAARATDVAFPENILKGEDSIPRVTEALSGNHWALRHSYLVLQTVRQYYKAGGAPEEIVKMVQKQHSERIQRIGGFPDYAHISRLPTYILTASLFHHIDRLPRGEFALLDAALSHLIVDSDTKDLSKVTELETTIVPLGNARVIKYSFYRRDFNCDNNPLARMADLHGFSKENLKWDRVILIACDSVGGPAFSRN